MRSLIYVLSLLLILGVGLSSCRTQYVPVETIKEKIEYRDRWQRDSIHVKDSVFMWAKGDTVFRDRWHTEYKDKYLRDTTYIQVTDSIQIPYPVERKLSWWESVKIETGGIAIGGITVLLLIIFRLIYKNRHK